MSLVTVEQPLTIDPQFNLPLLSLTFGFATDEIYAAGQLFDAFSISLQNLVTSNFAVLATTDAGGTVLAPATPGGVTLAPSVLALTSAAFPSLQPVLADQDAFRLVFNVPGEFLGAPLKLYFDLFDNVDPVPSLGFFSDIVVESVPEPGAAGLLLTGMGFLILFQPWKRR